MKVEVGELRALGESFDEAAGRVSREGPLTRPQIFFQEASINQYGVVSRGHDKENQEEEAPQPRAEPKPS